MVALKSHFEAQGTKWIWILAWDGGTTTTNALGLARITAAAWWII